MYRKTKKTDRNKKKTDVIRRELPKAWFIANLVHNNHSTSDTLCSS